MSFYWAEYDLDAELGSSGRQLAKNVMQTLGCDDYKQFREIASEATARSVSEVINFASYIGVDEEILEVIEHTKQVLTLPCQDVQVTDRLVLIEKHGETDIVDVNPSALLLKQIFKGLQAAYGNELGFFLDDDYRRIKSETIAFVNRYGTGLRIADELIGRCEEHGRRLFAEPNIKRGRTAVASYFATSLSLPRLHEVENIELRNDYVHSLPGWFDVTLEDIRKKHPNRSSELDDFYTHSLRIPMTEDQLRSMLDMYAQNIKPKRILFAVQ